MVKRPVRALIPVRSPGEGKTRLGSAGLSTLQRARLSAAMLADVAGALSDSPVDSVTVAANGSDAAAAAAALGLDVIADPPGTSSLDEAVAAATARLGASATLLVVMADLPRLEATDVAEVLATSAPVVVAPTQDGGTGALLRSPPGVIATAYGPNSAERHRQLAKVANVDVATVISPGFAEDIDTLEDLRRLQQGVVRPATGTVIAELLVELRAQ